MGNGFFEVPIAINEPVKSYAPGSPERKEVLETYKKMYDSKVEVPLFINGKEVKTKDTATMAPPHDHKHVLGNGTSIISTGLGWRKASFFRRTFGATYLVVFAVIS